MTDLVVRTRAGDLDAVRGVGADEVILGCVGDPGLDEALDTYAQLAESVPLAAASGRPIDQIERQIATNLTGPINVARAVLPVMREQRSGNVVSISSTAGRSRSSAASSPSSSSVASTSGA